MKKLILAALLITACTFSANAQLLRFGIKAGPNFANLDGDGLDYKSRTSFHAGAVAEIKAFPNFSIQPELLYSSQGAEVDGVGDFNLDYVSVPVLAKFYLLTDLLSLEVGPQFSFLVNESDVVINNVRTSSNSESFDFAVAGGAGVNITNNIFAQARYVVGLTEVSPDAKTTNTVFQLSVGYMF